MVACSLLMISSRLKELHCLLLIASALRHHMAACKAAMLRVDRSVQSARKALVKVMSQFEVEGVAQTEASARWPHVRGALRQELQVRAPAATAAAFCRCAHDEPQRALCRRLSSSCIATAAVSWMSMEMQMYWPCPMSTSTMKLWQ